ncbi:hypothetical protein [Muribaculum intestinale]|uniref:hypothetical protein n=3 Tax=Bacteroidales TaxID=171549 RepID=UPI0025B1D983|nr:hypothetical protein [Muribaculum intestinale]
MMSPAFFRVWTLRNLTKKNDTPVDIDTLSGIAVGCIGMGHTDFCRCTPPEFQAIFDQWHNRERNLDRGMWERARMMCICILQPYSKEPLSPTDIIRLPWDEEKLESVGTAAMEQEDMPELKRRFSEVKARYGLR